MARDGALPAQYDCDVDADEENIPMGYMNRSISPGQG